MLHFNGNPSLINLKPKVNAITGAKILMIMLNIKITTNDFLVIQSLSIITLPQNFNGGNRRRKLALQEDALRSWEAGVE